MAIPFIGFCSKGRGEKVDEDVCLMMLTAKIVVVVVVAKSYPTLCDPMYCSTPGSSVLHCILEFVQTRVHWVGGAELLVAKERRINNLNVQVFG